MSKTRTVDIEIRQQEDDKLPMSLGYYVEEPLSHLPAIYKEYKSEYPSIRKIILVINMDSGN